MQRMTRPRRRQRVRRISIGRVHAVVAAGYAVVRLRAGLRVGRHLLGLDVYSDEEMRRKVGTLADIIGSVEEPYAVVRLSSHPKGEGLSEGQELYAFIMPRRPGPGRGRRTRPGRRPRGGRRIVRSGKRG